MIERHHELSIKRQAKLLKLSRGAVYYLPKPVSPVDLALMRRIDELHLEPPLHGRLRSSTPIRAASSRPRNSQTSC